MANTQTRIRAEGGLYPTKTFDRLRKGLKGLSAEQMDQHYQLYVGYVTNINKLLEERAKLLEGGQAGTPEFAELTRRQGFEWNGMVLHELFFENLKADAGPLDPKSRLGEQIARAYGSVETWRKAFEAVCKIRGVGWAILYQDPATGWLHNFWVDEHMNGHPAGYRPILLVDLWEHAWTVDHKPTERAKYLEAIFQNLDWEAAEQRLLPLVGRERT